MHERESERFRALHIWLLSKPIDLNFYSLENRNEASFIESSSYNKVLKCGESIGVEHAGKSRSIPNGSVRPI